MQAVSTKMAKVVGNIPRQANSNVSPQQAEVVQVTPQVAGLINKVFRELQGIFPAWRGALQTEEAVNMAKQQWIKALAENGITTHEQLRRGFRQARKSTNPFLPSVGLFIKWCEPTPEDIGFMSFEEARKRIVDRNYSHQAIKAMMNHMGGTRTSQSLSAVDLEKKLDKAYAATFAQAKSGIEFTEIQVALAEKRTYSAKEYQEMGRRGASMAKAQLEKHRDVS